MTKKLRSGIMEASNFDGMAEETTGLPARMEALHMKTTEELSRMIRRGSQERLAGAEFETPTPGEYLRELLQARELSTRSVIRRCNLDRSYCYQLLNGTRVPSRELIVRLALELRFTEAETQRLLKLAQRPVLYARNRRDAAVLYGLTHGLGADQVNALLRDLGEEPLT